MGMYEEISDVDVGVVDVGFGVLVIFLELVLGNELTVTEGLSLCDVWQNYDYFFNLTSLLHKKCIILCNTEQKLHKNSCFRFQRNPSTSLGMTGGVTLYTPNLPQFGLSRQFPLYYGQHLSPLKKDVLTYFPH